MADYSKGKVYRLTCNDPNLIYYGSSIQTLKQRFNHHKNKLNCSSKKLFEVGGVEIELVLECPCDTLKELREIEQTYIDNDECINVNRSYISKETIKQYKKEYQETEPQKIKRKLYQQKNVLEKSIYDVEYRIKNNDKLNKDIECECGGYFKLHHKSTHIKTKKHIRYFNVKDLD